MAVLRNYTLQDLFRNLAGSVNANSDTSTQFEVVDNFVNDAETLVINVSGSPPAVTTNTNYPVNVAGDYPVAYWRLAETSATGTAFDSNQNLFSIYPRISSTSMANVTQNSTSFLSHSRAATFTNSPASSITFANNSSLQITGDLTVEFWVNFSSFQTNGSTYSLITKNVTAGGGVGEFEIYLFNNAGAGQISFNQNNTFPGLTAGSMSLSAWHHVAITRVAATKVVTIYIDGTSAGNVTYTNTPTTTTGTVIIGAAGSFQTAAYRMTEVAVYRKALSSTRVASHNAWGVASDAQATAYGGIGSFYGLFPYPAYGAPTTEAYGSGTTWGTFQWK